MTIPIRPRLDAAARRARRRNLRGAALLRQAESVVAATQADLCAPGLALVAFTVVRGAKPHRRVLRVEMIDRDSLCVAIQNVPVGGPLPATKARHN